MARTAVYEWRRAPNKENPGNPFIQRCQETALSFLDRHQLCLACVGCLNTIMLLIGFRLENSALHPRHRTFYLLDMSPGMFAFIGTAVPFWRQTSQILSILSPTTDCSPKLTAVLANPASVSYY